MTELILMRHGRTSATKQHIYCGLCDLPLSNDAYSGVEKTAALLPAFSQVYASDLLRARQTAKIIAPDIDVRLRPALREINFGVFDGHTADEIAQCMPELWRAYMKNSTGFDFPEGDDAQEFAVRIRTDIKAIAAAHDGERILVVTHKGVILATLSMLLHGDMSRMFCYDIRPAGFARIAIDGDAAILKQLC